MHGNIYDCPELVQIKVTCVFAERYYKIAAGGWRTVFAFAFLFAAWPSYEGGEKRTTAKTQQVQRLLEAFQGYGTKELLSSPAYFSLTEIFWLDLELFIGATR